MTTIAYSFDLVTVNLIVRGLGKLPYEEVVNVIDAMNNHATATLAQAAAAAEQARAPKPEIPETPPRRAPRAKRLKSA